MRAGPFAADVRGGKKLLDGCQSGEQIAALEHVRESAARVHRELLTPLIGALTELGEEDPRRTALLLQGIVNAATTAIEAGDDHAEVTDRAVRMAVTAITGAAAGR
ncbi:hypothetical protein ACFRFL_20370 [Streptomyces sp. NPDC056708]|uniref:hypothetical protein n=1 Tax=unclassified Streptomyces TaxID=2593676 RepID=UPI0036D17054